MQRQRAPRCIAPVSLLQNPGDEFWHKVSQHNWSQLTEAAYILTKTRHHSSPKLGRFDRFQRYAKTEKRGKRGGSPFVPQNCQVAVVTILSLTSRARHNDLVGGLAGN